ncbi:crossover junction endonuclease EME1 [Phlebotomus argentipes]|uniref:crossover junction endonuclease EME1 n=1 Tax=Phlebotomus argentipes TaxID=94469 RepID=UPI002892BCE8|nr:crossover junction endonuclease EME1 [Phlebotomus argentipes]
MAENSQSSTKHVKQRKNLLKPGECHKHILVEIDPGIIANECGSQITQELSQADMQSEIKSQMLPMTITWRRDFEGCPESGDFLLYVILGQEMLDSVKEDSFKGRIESLKGIFPGKTPVIIVYGLKETFRKGKKSVSRMDIEMSLVEVQIMYNCCHRLVENPADLAATVVQFSKSIAETPFKREEIEKALSEDCYFSSHSKGNVKIQNGAGYSRLWQEHLIKFPHVALEAAQAITGAYPMPRLLVNALDASDDPENLLANIPVRRSGGPLAAQRKVGQELSRKICTLYTTENPDTVL